MQVDAIFRRNKDVAGAIWWTDHPYDHPRFKYEINGNYTGSILEFDLEVAGDCSRLDTVHGTSLSVELEDGTTKFVRLWNYRADRSNTDPYKQRIRIPFTSELYSNYLDPFDGTRTQDYLDRVRVDPSQIAQIMLPVTPRDYMGGEAVLDAELFAGDFRIKIHAPNGAILSSGDVLSIPTDDGMQTLTVAGDPGSDRGPLAFYMEDGTTLRFSWNVPAGVVSDALYEVTVKTPAGTWTPVGTTGSTVLDYLPSAYLNVFPSAPSELEWRVKLADGLSPFAFGSGPVGTEPPENETDYPRVHGSTWGDIVFTWPARSGAAAYEVSVLNAGREWEVIGTTNKTFFDFPVEDSIPMFDFPPTAIQWRVKVAGSSDYIFEYQSTVLITNAFVKRVIPFMGQSNVGHFSPLSGEGGRKDKTSAGTFRRHLADALGLRPVCIMPLEACWGSSAAERMADPDPVKGRNHWWDIENDKPGPRLLHAVGLMKSIGVSVHDAIWAQGEQDISMMDAGHTAFYTGLGLPQPSIARLTLAWTKIWAYLRQQVNPDLHIYLQKISTPWYGSPPAAIYSAHTAQARIFQNAVATPVPNHSAIYDPYDEKIDGQGVGDIPAIFFEPAVIQNGFYWDVRVPVAFNALSEPKGARIEVETAVNAPLVEENRVTMKLLNVRVTGSNTSLLIEQRNEPANTLGMTDGYDNAYNLTPEFCAERTYSLGYRGDYVMYTGISHFHNFSRTTDVQDTNVKWRLHTSGERVNTPTKLWFADFAKHLKQRGFELWVSVSYEILKAIMPPEWIQVSATGSTSTTGWYPPSGLVEPTSLEGTQYLANVACEFLDVVQANGLRPKYQIGEPWWWDGSYSDGKPCFYSDNTRAKYLKETGLAAPVPYLETTSPTSEELEIHRHYLEWLGTQLGWSTNTQMDIVKARFPNVQTAILVFTPQVLNPKSPVNAIVNLPSPMQWGPSKFDILQIEDYDWITGDYDQTIGDRWELMQGTWDMALNHLGYPLSRVHYFTGFNLNADTDWKWTYIDAAGELGIRKGAAKVFPWSREQVLRDGFIYRRRIPPKITIQTNARVT
ncbi:hypothetical protein [Castellaniella sp.]|uniref:non-contractile tail sheath protein n=1 Tax=Castellaniella sp. TaxID=1955812 RepID=UPI002AFEDB58|nr:hypothetical protein [Castellaniella sp.]